MAVEPIILEECEITIQEDDGNTPPLTAQLMEACSAQRVTLAPIHHEMRNRQPGVAFEEARAVIVGWTISIQGLVLLQKVLQIDPFKDGTKQWRIYVYNANKRLSNSARDRWDFRGSTILGNTPNVQLAEQDFGRIDYQFQAEREVA